MWVLDVVHATTHAIETSFYLIAGEWSIGRKKCHFNFQADASISRTHAVLRVGALSLEQLRDPSSRPALVLVDQNSRFGSFVNQEQCFGERALAHGDQVTFGAKRTVLRVRYQLFVLVASRIHRHNRARVQDTCQRIGMHLIATESAAATHCIMDPGRIIATVKVLWALVHNQPVVTTPWIYAILERKSLSEPLPRCEPFLPTDEVLPSVASNYLPNPMRETLFRHHAVVFLVPQSMEQLITAMDGIAVTAYKDPDHDEQLLREIEQLAVTRQVLIVEPSQGSGYSSGAASSDGREIVNAPNHTASVDRRVELFRSMHAPFTTIQELAASVIFVKTPITTSECSFSSSLAGHNSISAQIMSFPEHLSLRGPRNHEDDEDDEDDNQNEPQSSSDIHDNAVETDNTSLVPETASRVHSDDPIPQPAPPPPAKPRGLRTTDRQPTFDDHASSSTLPIKEEPSLLEPSPSPAAPLEVPLKSDAVGTDRQPKRALQIPTARTPATEFAKLVTPAQDEGLDHDQPAASRAVRRPASSDGGWVSSRDLVPRSVDPADDDCDDRGGSPQVPALVMTCSLVVKRPQSAMGDARSSSANDADGPNFKRFKKGNGYATQSTASLFPRQTVVSVTVNNADREAMHQNLRVLEEQERIAEELFAMVEKRTARKRT